VIVWFGLVMVTQAFQEVPKTHCVAVAFGLLPMLACWALELVDLALQKAGSSLFEAARRFGDELPIYGLIALSQGGLLVSMIWAAAIAYMLDRRFLHSARLATCGRRAVLLRLHPRLHPDSARDREPDWSLCRTSLYNQLPGIGFISAHLSFLRVSLRQFS